MGRKSEALVQPIRQQIVKAITAGVWLQGSRLPSTREMAKEMEADPRDIASAYRQLASEGLVELRPRSGAYVSVSVGKGSAPPGLGEGWMADILADAVAREIPAMEFGDWVHRCTGTLRLRVFVIAPTADQVAGLGSELTKYYGVEAHGATTDEMAALPALPLAMRRADLVITTEACRTVADQYVSESGLPSFSVSVRPDLMSETWRRLLKRGMTYVVMADSRFEGVLELFFANAGGASNVTRVVVGRDDLSAIPNDAIVYVTQAARAALGEQPVNGFILPPARVLSHEVTREILGFIVKENLAGLRGRHSEGGDTA